MRVVLPCSNASDIRAVSWAPTWAPGVGQKLKYGEQWKKQLHSTAATTVKIMQESKVRLSLS